MLCCKNLLHLPFCLFCHRHDVLVAEAVVDVLEERREEVVSGLLVRETHEVHSAKPTEQFMVLRAS